MSSTGVLLVALPSEISEHSISSLHSKFPHLEIKTVKTSLLPKQDEIKEKISADLWKQVTILVTFGAFPAHASDAPKLELVHLASAGGEQVYESDIWKSSNLSITTSNGIHGPQISEWIIMTGLAHARHLRKWYDLQKQHQFKNEIGEGPPVRDQTGRRMGILGYGSIGRQVGRLAKALGMDVLAFTATPKDTPEKRRDDGYIVPGTGDAKGEWPSKWYSGLDKERNSLNEFLAQDLDWLVVTLPLTPQTKKMLGKREFETLSQGGKRPAFISNISRGGIINQPELITALKQGTIAGAALDVTDPEPLPSDNELWDAPNVTITPHISGHTAQYFDRVFAVLELNMERKAAGKALTNLMQRDRGY